MTKIVSVIFPFLLILLVFISSCQNPIDDFIDHTITLSNQLGSISIKLPPIFDTSFVWKNVGDGDSYQMYRFANRNYSLIRETGSFYLEFPDSLLQFTISHNDGKEIYTDNDAFNLDSIVSRLNKKNYESCMGCDSITWRIREHRIISDHDFIVIGFEELGRYASLGRIKVLEAITWHHQNTIHFRSECSGSNCGDFIATMSKSLNTIKMY